MRTGRDWVGDGVRLDVSQAGISVGVGRVGISSTFYTIVSTNGRKMS